MMTTQRRRKKPAVPFDDESLGLPYIIRQIAEDVRTIRGELNTFATKSELADQIRQLREQLNQGPVAGWLVSAISTIIAIIAVVVAYTHPGGH